MFLKIGKVIFTVVVFHFCSVYLVSAKNSCTENCMSKTYCISAEDSENCSRNNLLTAKFTVVQKSSPNEYLQLTLTGYHIEPKETKTISVSLKDQSGLATSYSCTKTNSESTSCKVTTGAEDHVAGTSSYSNDVLSCSWVFNYEDDIWPKIHNKPVDLINDDSLSIVLNYGPRKVTVAQDTSELPIYKVNFLKCCNKVHGNDDYALTFKQTDHVDYFLQFTSIKNPPNSASIVLRDPNGVEVMFECYFDSGYLKANILTASGNSSASVSEQLYDQHLTENRCSWSSPLVISSEPGEINTTNTLFDLEVVADNAVVYAEKGVSLGSNASSLKISFTIIITLVMTFLCKIYDSDKI